MSPDFALEDDLPFSAADDPEPEAAEAEADVDEDSFAAVGEVVCCACPLLPPPPW